MRYTKVELLERAQQLLNASITLIEKATEGDANTEAYLIDHLKIYASEDHGFLSDDLNLDTLMRKYEDEEEIEFSSEVEDIMDGNF